MRKAIKRLGRYTPQVRIPVRSACEYGYAAHCPTNADALLSARTQHIKRKVKSVARSFIAFGLKLDPELTTVGGRNEQVR